MSGLDRSGTSAARGPIGLLRWSISRGASRQGLPSPLAAADWPQPLVSYEPQHTRAVALYRIGLGPGTGYFSGADAVLRSSE